MRIIPDDLDALPSPRLADGDPLPPEDRRGAAPGLALEALYRTQTPRLLRLFRRRTDSQDAHDLLQESFARLAGTAAEPGKTIDQPEAYLTRIAGNLLRNRARSALQRSLADHVPVEDVNPAGPDPVAAIEARDLLNRIQSALHKLGPRTCDIFLAHRIDGLSYKEIASSTGLSVKGVEWHMTKAIAHIDRVMRRR
ncbi:MAG: RNA polymerase subunit sigma-24 [Sphingomonas sp.]|nr:MAG: RNA polymerase subunit sigma-24 [Sphingomonas sp.]